MSHRIASFTQAEVARICRGAKQEGLGIVHIELPSGVKFSIPLNESSQENDPASSRQNDDEEKITFTL